MAVYKIALRISTLDYLFTYENIEFEAWDKYSKAHNYFGLLS
jgi:hypothetical protein